MEQLGGHHGDGAAGATERSAWRLQLRYMLPAMVFLVMVVVLAIGLTLDPRHVPSPLIGKDIPEFELPPLPGRDNGLSSVNLRGEVSLVNVFASWCTACRYEHPLFMELQQRGVVPVHGISYKDRPQDAEAWLAELGDPYTRIGADRDGRVAIDWGVYGVPETYLIDREGRIAFKQIGPVTAELLEEQILPLVENLRRTSSTQTPSIEGRK